jgi:hypothetical protein
VEDDVEDDELEDELGVVVDVATDELVIVLEEEDVETVVLEDDRVAA